MKTKINLILLNNLFLPYQNLSLKEIFEKIGFTVLKGDDTKKIIDSEFYFVITEYIHLAILEKQNKKEKAFVNNEEILGLYLKGSTYKKNLKKEKGNLSLELSNSYIEKNIKFYEMDNKEFISFTNIEPEIISFLYKLNLYRHYYNEVLFPSLDNILIDWEVLIEKGVTLHQNIVIKGNTKIKKGAIIYPFTYLENVKIGKNAIIFPFSHIVDSTLENNTSVGPYSRLRQNTIIKEGAKTGDFVKMKNTVFGKGSKAMHLSYVGDATVGKNVNIGAGTITCNYDGINKNPTTIEDNVFVGSGTELVAPVKIRKNSYIAAGSTITKEVPSGALGIARARQENKLGWVERKRKRLKE